MILVLKSNLVAKFLSVYQPSNTNPSFTGAVGAVITLFLLTLTDLIAGAPFVSNLTVRLDEPPPPPPLREGVGSASFAIS